MTTMTDQEAEAARVALAAHDAAKAEAARVAENEKRASARDDFAPLTEIIPDLTALAGKVRSILADGLGAENGLMTLTGNVEVVINSLLARVERRTADTEPVPETPQLPAPQV